MKKVTIFMMSCSFMIMGLLFITSCTDEIEDILVADPVASFQSQVSEANYAEVTFTNFSQHATTYAWNFGDTNTSTDESPVHVFTETGEFTITLLSSNADGETSTFSETLTITDPLEAQRILIGASGKVWQLIADASTGVNPIQVGPTNRSEVWWSYGGVDILCVRECVMDDTWTFNTDGTFTFENNGDFWGDEGIWPAELVGCFDATDAANWTGAEGQDLSDWDSGTHGFTYDPTTATLDIDGGFIGLTKAGTSSEVTAPESSVTYSVIKLVDADVDTLVLETTIDGGYWSMTLVSYDNAADAIVTDECPIDENPTLISEVSIDFESNPPTWNPFGGPSSDGVGVTPSTVANPVSGGINTSATVGQLEEVDGSAGWTGISTVLSGKVDFSTKQTFKVKVYSPFAGAVVKFKLEDSGNASNNKEIDVATTAADSWEELTFTFSADDSGKWDVMVLFFDFKDAAKSGARTHYFDDIILQ